MITIQIEAFNGFHVPIQLIKKNFIISFLQFLETKLQ
jgi:hypothetical protein